MKDSNVFSCICDVTVKDINNPSKEELDYLFSFPDNLEKSIYQYVETKTISKFLVNHIKSNGAPIDSFIYRGDCFYKGNVGVGKRFKLWRDVASFPKILIQLNILLTLSVLLIGTMMKANGT